MSAGLLYSLSVLLYNTIAHLTFKGGLGGGLVGCLSFTSSQHLRSYQDLFRLVTVHDFIVLPHWKTRLLAPWLDISHYPDTETISPCPILITLSAWLRSDNDEKVIRVYIIKSSIACLLVFTCWQHLRSYQDGSKLVCCRERLGLDI